MQKILGIIASVVCVFVLAACGGSKKKELTQLEQAQINQHLEAAKREVFIKNYSAAEQSLVEITKIDATNYQVWFELATLRAGLKKKSESLAAYKNAFKQGKAAFGRDANNQDALVISLRSLVLLGRGQEARDMLAKAVKKNPDNTAYKHLEQQKFVDQLMVNNYYEMARQAVAAKNDAAAEDALTKLTKVDATNYQIWFELGVLRMRLKQNTKARAAYDNSAKESAAAFAKDANNHNALFANLRALVLLNRAQDARDFMATVARQYPASETYRKWNEQKVVDQLLRDDQLKNATVK